jgi:hypothetical protein
VVNGRYPYEEGVNNIWINMEPAALACDPPKSYCNKKEFEKKFWKKFSELLTSCVIHILGVKKIVGKKMGKFLLKIFGVNGC